MSVNPADSGNNVTKEIARSSMFIYAEVINKTNNEQVEVKKQQSAI